MSLQLSILVALITLVAIIAVCRWFVARNEDDFLHTAPGADQLVNKQAHIARILDRIDYAGASLTVVTFVFAAFTVARGLMAGLANRGM